MYEMITFGSFPFQGLSNNQVLEHVKDGHTLSIPSGIKSQLYVNYSNCGIYLIIYQYFSERPKIVYDYSQFRETLLKSCWHMTATKRPTASEVVELLSNTPRLICPCIDIPLASVQVERTDSLELIPSVRKPSGSVSRTNKPVLNSTNKRLKDHSGSSGYQTHNSNHNASSESTNNAPTPKSTNGAYSPMSGLLNYHSHSNGRTNTESPHPRIDFSGTIL